MDLHGLQRGGEGSASLNTGTATAEITHADRVRAHFRNKFRPFSGLRRPGKVTAQEMAEKRRSIEAAFVETYLEHDPGASEADARQFLVENGIIGARDPSVIRREEFVRGVRLRMRSALKNATGSSDDGAFARARAVAGNAFAPKRRDPATQRELKTAVTEEIASFLTNMLNTPGGGAKLVDAALKLGKFTATVPHLGVDDDRLKSPAVSEAVEAKLVQCARRGCREYQNAVEELSIYGLTDPQEAARPRESVLKAAKEEAVKRVGAEIRSKHLLSWCREWEQGGVVAENAWQRLAFDKATEMVAAAASVSSKHFAGVLNECVRAKIGTRRDFIASQQVKDAALETIVNALPLEMSYRTATKLRDAWIRAGVLQKSDLYKDPRITTFAEEDLAGAVPAHSVTGDFMKRVARWTTLTGKEKRTALTACKLVVDAVSALIQGADESERPDIADAWREMGVPV